MCGWPKSGQSGVVLLKIWKILIQGLYTRWTEKYNDVVKNIMTVQIRSATELDQASESLNEDLANLSDVKYQHADPDSEVAGSTGDRGAEIDIQPAPMRTGPKIGRNDPCTCGSGKKYKNCCGALA